jgi:glc operon protein GlcG
MTTFMTLSTARQLVTDAIEKANADYKRPICVAICDAYGFPIAFARMDGAPIRSIDISRRKAFTAVRMGMTTGAFLERLQKEGWQAGYFGEDMLPLPGGVPLKDASGAIVGAIGISGLAAHEDHAIADAVAAKILR